MINIDVNVTNLCEHIAWRYVKIGYHNMSTEQNILQSIITNANITHVYNAYIFFIVSEMLTTKTNYKKPFKTSSIYIISKLDIDYFIFV